MGGFWCTFLRFYFEKRKSIPTQFDVRPSSMQGALSECKIVMGLCRRREKSPSTIFYKTLFWSKKISLATVERERQLRESFESQTTAPFFRTKQMFPPPFSLQSLSPEAVVVKCVVILGDVYYKTASLSIPGERHSDFPQKQDIKYFYLFEHSPSSVFRPRLGAQVVEEEEEQAAPVHGEQAREELSYRLRWGSKIIFPPCYFRMGIRAWRPFTFLRCIQESGRKKGSNGAAARGKKRPGGGEQKWRGGFSFREHRSVGSWELQESPSFSKLAWEIINNSKLPEYVLFLETWQADYFWRMSLRERMQLRRKMKGNGRSRVCLGLLRETSSDRPNTHTHTPVFPSFHLHAVCFRGGLLQRRRKRRRRFTSAGTHSSTSGRTEEGREIPFPRALQQRNISAKRKSESLWDNRKTRSHSRARGGSRRCTFAAANYTPSSSLISFLSRRRFPELHSELLFNQGSGVRCFLLPTIGFSILFAPGFKGGPIFQPHPFWMHTPERMVVEDPLKVSLERSPVFFKTLSPPRHLLSKKASSWSLPPRHIMAPDTRGPFNGPSPLLPLLPCFFCLSASCVPLFLPLPLEEQGRVKKVPPLPLLSSHRPFVLVRFPLSAIFPHRRKYTFTQTRQILTAFFKKIKIWEGASYIRDKMSYKIGNSRTSSKEEETKEGEGSQSVEMGRGKRKKKKGWVGGRKRRKRVSFTLVRGRYVISGSEETLFLRHHPYFLVFCAFAKKTWLVFRET